MDEVSSNENDGTMARKCCPNPDLSIDGFRLYSAGSLGRPLHFTTEDEEVYPKDAMRGERTGTLLIRIGVDLEADLVAIDANRSSELELLDVAIEDLRRIRDTLAAIAPSSVEGQCMNGAGWGRCEHRTGHDGPCEGPTEAEWEATQQLRRPPRVA